jgi:hypothetical protein
VEERQAMNWNRIERWEYVIDAVASEYHKKFPICELEDIKQALYKWFIEHPNKLGKQLVRRMLRILSIVACVMKRWIIVRSGKPRLLAMM